jgi:hypothetical protein
MIFSANLRINAIVAVTLALGFPAAGLSQVVPPDSKTPPAKSGSQTPAKTDKGPKPDAAKKSDDSDDDDTLDYEKFVKDLKRIDGPMALYQKGKNLYLELPEDKLDKVFLIQAAFDTGLDNLYMHAGMPLGDKAVDAFKFERKDDMVWLERPNIANRWTDQSTFATGAQRSFPDAMLNTFRVEQTNNDKKLLLVNVTSLFYGDIFHLGEMIAGGLGGPYQLDMPRSEPVAVKGFPDDTVVQMKLHFFSQRGADPNPLMALFGLSDNTLEDDRSAPVQIVYSMWWRKDDNYVPRMSDPRIGNFTTEFFSVDRFLDEDKQVRYIDRFNLQKKDPKAKLSDPVKPIVFTVDNSIPEKYRPAIKAGVLRWNKAFEAIGYKNAIQVQDIPKTDKDYDHADGRYNVIRMMVGPSAPFAAISLLRTDPFSGEILNASITLDGNVLQELASEHERNLPISLGKGALRKTQVLLRDPSRTITDDKYLFETPQEELMDQAEARMAKFGWTNELCSYGSDLANQSELGWDALQMNPGGSPVSIDEYVNEFLSDAVCHEVGHCLGLMHNFAGSTLLTTDQLGDSTVTKKDGITASVMDYMPPNAQAILKGKGEIFMDQVGTYDQWAIKYDYMDTGAKTPDEERYAISQVASESGLPGHAFVSDEEADMYDPAGVRFDAGKDPLNFSAKQLEELRRARHYAIAELPKPGTSYSQRTRIVLGSIIKAFNEGRIAARFIGGTYGNHNFKGDEGEKPTLAPVPASTQRQAMRLIANEFFAPDSFDLPKPVMESLSLDQDELAGSPWNAPLREIISGMQSNLLALVMGASATDRIAENSFKTGSGSYSLTEHYDRLLHSICAEIGENQSISPLRRDLQRFFVQALMLQAGAPQGGISDDVRLVATDSLQRLDKEMGVQLAKPAKLDDITKLHLKEMRQGIDRFLARRDLVSG